MKYVLIYFLCCVGIYTHVFAQNILWERFYGGTQYDAGQKLLLMPDGSLIMAGEVRSQDGLGLANHSNNSDVFVRQMAAQGIIYWQKILGGKGMELLADIAPSPEGGVVVLATTDSYTGDPGEGEGYMDMWVVKISPQGDIVWKSRFGGTGNDRAYTIIPISSGGYLIGGSSGSRNGNMKSYRSIGIDSWVARLDEQGRLMWEKHFGGRKNEWATKLLEVRPGWFLVMNGSDSVDGDIEKNYGKKDAWIFMIDSWGNMEWQISLGAGKNDEIHDCLIAPNGDIMLAGTTLSSGGMIPEQRGRGDFWLVRMTQKGQVLWNRTFGGTWSEGISSICPSASGGYLLAGLTKSRDMDIDTLRGFYDALLVEVDESGNKIWSGTLGHAAKDALFSVKLTPNGTYLGIGFSEINPEPAEDEIIPHIGGFDVWLVNFTEPDKPLENPYLTPVSISGVIKNKATGEPVSTQITFRDGLDMDSLSSARSEPATGKFLAKLPRQGFVGVEVFEPGFMYYGENLLLDTLFSKPRLQRTIELAPIRTGEKGILGNVYFDPGRWEILPTSRAELQRMLRFLRLNPSLVIELGGHTDNTGRREDKQQLSQNRANAVRNYLIDQGVDPRRLIARGYGMSDPIASNNTTTGRRKNRRVEFMVLRMK